MTFSSGCFNDLWVFDCISKKWNLIDGHAQVPTKRHGHSLTLVNDIAILFGGYGGATGRLNDTWKLDPSTLFDFPFNIKSP